MRKWVLLIFLCLYAFSFDARSWNLESEFDYSSYVYSSLFGHLSWNDRIESAQLSDGRRLEYLTDNNGGFWQLSDYEIELGIAKQKGQGVDLTAPFYNPYGESWMGISFGFEKVSSFRTYQWREDLEQEKNILNPFVVDSIINWRAGEWTKHGVKGSIFVSGNWSHYLYSTGLSLFLSGEFNVSVIRLKDDYALL
ncbi:MAG: hypothetical protein ACOCUH_03195, partial [Bacteriovoracia bacterium]